MNVYLLKRDDNNFYNSIKNLGVDNYCINLMNDKTKLPIYYLKDIKIEQANILKQTALSVGCDFAIHKNVISGTKKMSNAIMMCSYSQIKKIKNKLKNQPFSLEIIIKKMLDIVEYESEWYVHQKNILENKDFIIMGILNVTPDSFYDGGKHVTLNSILKYTEEMIEHGADVIDIGGESTKPFSDKIDSKEEVKRTASVVKEIRNHFKNILISIDTYKSDVAKRALDFGADIVNDISAYNFDNKMVNIIKEYKASSVIMHMKGMPKNMQINPQYEHLLFEINDYLEDSINKAVKQGINEKTIVVDPGIGFGKTVDDNYIILRSLNIFLSLKKAILIGTSNKSFIGKYLNLNENERIEGTIASNVYAYINGAKIFRVHNVKENVRALKITAKTGNMYDRF